MPSCKRFLSSITYFVWAFFFCFLLINVKSGIQRATCCPGRILHSNSIWATFSTTTAKVCLVPLACIRVHTREFPCNAIEWWSNIFFFVVPLHLHKCRIVCVCVFLYFLYLLLLVTGRIVTLGRRRVSMTRGKQGFPFVNVDMWQCIKFVGKSKFEELVNYGMDELDTKFSSC